MEFLDELLDVTLEFLGYPTVKTRGRVRAEPSFQLGPARTRTDTLRRDRRQTRLTTNQPANQSDSTHQLKAGNFVILACVVLTQCQPVTQ